MAGPADWGAIPLSGTPGTGAPPTGPAAWGAIPLSASPAASAAPAKPTIDPSIAEGIARAGASGVPILGGLMNKLDAATNAALAPYVDPLLPDSYEKLSEPTFAGRYQHALSAQEGKDTAFAAEHPALQVGGELAGGIASTGVAAGTSLGAKLLGLTGGLPEMATFGAGSNAVINGVDAAVRGENPWEAGGLGLALGGAAPIVSRGASLLARPVANAIRSIRDPEGMALERIAQAQQIDQRSGLGGLTPQQYDEALARGQPVNQMDLGGETTRALARSAANTSPEGRGVLSGALNDRFNQQANRMSDWLNNTFNFPNAEAQQRAIDAVEQEANARAYDLAYRTGNTSVWTPELQRLARAPDVQEAILGGGRYEGNQSILSGFQQPRRNPFVPDGTGGIALREFDNSTAVPDIAFWDGVKKRMQDREGSLLRSGNNQQAAQTGNLRRALVTQLDAAVPAYQEARAGAARFFGAENALEAGQNFAMPNARFQNDVARQAVAQMSPLEQQLFQDGYVSRLVQQIQESPDRANAFRGIAQSPAAQDRLEIAVGPQRAQEVRAYLHVENLMNAGRQAVQGNSTTARQLVELGLAGGVGGIESGGNFTDPEALMHAALVYGALRGQRAINERVSNQVARLLTSTDRNRFATGVRIVAHNPNLFGAIQRSDAAIAGFGAHAALPTITSGILPAPVASQ